MSGARDAELVLFANEAFYLAFAGGDFEAMQKVWSQRSDIACAHPGREPLVGFSEVMESWRALLTNPPSIRVVSPGVNCLGGSAFVICYEEIGGSYLLATNIFLRANDQWRMVHHHAAATRSVPPIPKSPEPGKIN